MQTNPLTDTIMGIIKDLAEFSQTQNVVLLSKARHSITDLAVDRVAVADSLWDITLYLQRALLSTECDEEVEDDLSPL